MTDGTGDGDLLVIADTHITTFLPLILTEKKLDLLCLAEQKNRFVPAWVDTLWMFS
jgi:hypothetical protein